MTAAKPNLLARYRFARNIGFRFILLRLAAAVLCPRYRLRYSNLDWMADPAFERFLHNFDEAHPLRSINAGRRFMVSQLLRLTEQVPGDTAECGVYLGASSYLIASFISRSSLEKTHHLFDSFDGLSLPIAADGEHWRQHDLKVERNEAERRLSKFQNLRFYKGWIPERFGEVSNCRFSFVHIDVDLYEPTRDSIEFFYPRMNPGGIILCDDYGVSSCPGATKGVDEFLIDKPEKMVALSDGAGFLIKGVLTAPPYIE